MAKLLKLEKLINQLSKEIKIDKLNVVFMVLGEENVKKIEKMAQASKVDASSSPIPVQRPMSGRQF